MRTLGTFILLALVSVVALAQETSFFKSYYPPNNAEGFYGRAVVISQNQDYYLAGDNQIARFTPAGEMLWTKKITSNGSVYIGDITEYKNEGIFGVAAAFENANPRQPSLQLVKFNYEGVLQWTKKIVSVSGEGKILTLGNFIYLLFRHTPENSSNTETTIYKLSKEGNILKQITFTGRYIDFGIGDNTIIVGLTHNQTNQLKYLSPDLDLMQEKVISITAGNVYLTGMLTLPANEVLLTGRMNYDLLLLKINPSGITSWEKTYDFKATDFGYKLKQTTDGYLVAGFSNVPINFSDSGNEEDLILLKTDLNGNKTWVKAFGSANNENISDLIALPNGQIVMLGYLLSPFYTAYPFMMRTGTDGAVNHSLNLQQTNIATTTFDPSIKLQEGRAIIPFTQNGHSQTLIAGTYTLPNAETKIGWMIQDTQGNTTTPLVTLDRTGTKSLRSLKKITGGFIGLAEGESDIFGKIHYAFKLNETGGVTWISDIAGPTSYLHDIIALEEGGYLVAGNADVAFTDFDIWLIKLNEAGSQTWEKKIVTSKWDFVKKVLPTPDGYLLAGVKVNTYDGGQETFLTKVSKDGTLLWQKLYPMGAEDVVTSLEKINNDYLIGGYTITDFTGQEQHAFLLRANANGEKIWSHTYDFDKGDQLAKVLVSGEQIFICGTTGPQAGPLSSAALLANLSAAGDLQGQTFFGQQTTRASFHDMALDAAGKLQLTGLLEEEYGNNKILRYTLDLNPVNNQPPTDVQLSTLEIPNNTPAGALIGTFATQDPDAGDTHTYALVAITGSTDHTAFTINQNQLVAARTFNKAEKESYTLQVKSTDAKGASIEKTFNLTVSTVNGIDPDKDASGFKLVFQENNRALLTGENNYTGPLDITLYDLKGSKLGSWQLNKGGYSFRKELSFAAYNQEVTILNMVYGNQRWTRKFLVK